MKVKTYAEHIASLEATRADKAARMKAIQKIAMEDGEGRTLNQAESVEFDELEGAIKSIDVEIDRTKRLEAIDKSTAAPVDDGKKNAPAGTQPLRSELELKKVEKLDPGIAFARYAMCLTKAKGNHAMAAILAERHYNQTEPVVRLLKAQAEGFDLRAALQQKATVAAGTTTQATWAAPLVYAETFAGDFINFLRPRTLIGQASFRPIPFNVRIPSQTSGGTSQWVGQGRAKPATKFDFDALSTSYTKVAAIAVITQELARLSDPSAEMLVRDSLADCVIERIDSDLFDPDIAGVANVNPAGLLNGVNPVTGVAGAVDPDSIRCAILNLWAPWDTSFLGARPAYYTTPGVARFLASMRDALGNPSFPGMTMTGGTLDGVPVRTSQYLANNGGSAGAPFILVDESEVWLADDGSVTLDMSNEASIEMNTAPTQDSTVPTAAQLVSMWQTNSIAFRAERAIWWGKRRTGAVQWIDGFPSRC